MVEVFKTNINCKDTANMLVCELQHVFPGAHISFDLDDCDRILRIHGNEVASARVIQHLARRGHSCEVLD